MKPIIFCTDMVRAILDGRKTQTRRVVKPQPPKDTAPIHGPEWYEPAVVNRHGMLQPGDPVYGIYDTEGEWGRKCPYRPGDVLWVRETWQHNPCRGSGWPYDYKATPEYNSVEHDTWQPSIHMPKEAARLFLKVTAVRAERVQEITEEDALAEGIDVPFPSIEIQELNWRPTRQFKYLWNSINGKKWPWDKNPYVWVISFERTEVSP